MKAIIVVLCIACVSFSRAQQCQPFLADYAPISAPYCPLFLSSSIWVPVALPIAQTVMDTTFNKTILDRMKKIQPITPIKCYNLLISMYCNTVFQPCEEVFFPEYNRSIPIPVPACKSICEAVNIECHGFWKRTKREPIDCDYQSELLAGEAWPKDSLHMTIQDVPVYGRCFPLTELPHASLPWNSTEQPCPNPFAPIDSPSEEEPRCNMPCPVPMFTMDQWRRLGKLMTQLASISIACAFIQSTFLLANPNFRRARLRRFEFYASFSELMFSISFVLGGLNPVDNMWCNGTTGYSDSSRSSCGAQGFMFCYFSLTSAWWIGMTSGGIYFSLNDTPARKHVLRKHEIICSIVAWGVPLLLVAIPAGFGLIFYYYKSAVCFIQGFINDGELSYHFFLYYIPMGIPVFVTLLFSTLTLYRILKGPLKDKITGQPWRHTDAAAKAMQYWNIRMCIWTFAVSIVLGTVVFYRVFLGSRSAIESWVACKVNAGIGLGDSTKCPEDTMPTPVSYELTMAHYLVIATVGIYCFLASATNSCFYLFWFRLLKAIIRRDWSKAKKILTVDDQQKKEHKDRKERKVEMSSVQKTTTHTNNIETTETSNEVISAMLFTSSAHYSSVSHE